MHAVEVVSTTVPTILQDIGGLVLVKEVIELALAVHPIQNTMPVVHIPVLVLALVVVDLTPD